MRPGRAGLLGLLGAAASALPLGTAPVAAAPVAGGIARTAEFQRKVDAAIAKGVEWLRGTQGDTGAFPAGGGGGGEVFLSAYEFGTTSVAVHTLRSCGAGFDDPAVKDGLQRMREIWKAGRSNAGGRSTYEVSIALLALEAHYSAPDPAPAGKDRAAREPQGPRVIPAKDLEWIRQLAQFLIKAQTPSGGFGYDSPPGRKGWADLSNAQYALLGLKAARRCGVAVPKQVFHRALEHFLARQQESGPEVERRSDAGVDEPEDRYGRGRTRAAAKDHARGWGYMGPTGVTGSMTAAGVSSLVICRGELLGLEGYGEKADAMTVRAIRDGIAWLGHNFSVTGNPTRKGSAGSHWHYYYLYGLERAGVLAGVSWMAHHDWYGEGAHYLVGAQKPHGAWDAGQGMFGRQGNRPGQDGDFLDTCFALLFLKKATFRVEGAVATEERDDMLDLSKAASLDDASFDATFDAVFARYRRAAADRRGTLVTDFVQLGARALPRLIRRLDDAEEECRATAIAVLERVTGHTHGFRPGDPDEVRGRAVATWEEWWFANRGRLVADAGAGRFCL